MNVSLAFTRLFFCIISIFFLTTYMIAHPEINLPVSILIGVGSGLSLTALLILFDIAFRKFNFRSFNIAVMGLFAGYLMGLALTMILDAMVTITEISVTLHKESLEIIKICLFIFGTYLGTIMVLRSSDEIYISIPFVKFAASSEKKKDLLIDSSALADARIIDLCSSGLLDHHVIIPRFVIKELYSQLEHADEHTKVRNRRTLENVKKMEEMHAMGVRFNDTDFPEVKDVQSKMIRLARLLDANLLTADITRIQMASIEGIKVINLHFLSNALKPLMESGEYITIKVQRYGKEPRQGVGYLEDGTMVVINGGGNYIGETIRAQVLSVKHTSSGRMIFCNAPDEEYEYEEEDDEHR